MKIRYIRDWQNGRTINSASGPNCDWRQIMAIDYFGKNIAKGKANGVELPGNFLVGQGAFWSFITDENFNTNLWTSDRPNERKSVTIDLGDIYDIDKLVIARANNPAICKETKTEVSTDNIVWHTIFDSSIEGTYEEQQNGREFKLPDNRFNIPNEDSSLGEVINFFDEYLEFNKVQKNVLKSNLIDKGVEVADGDKMSTLIGKVKTIKNYPTATAGQRERLFSITNASSPYNLLREFRYKVTFEGSVILEIGLYTGIDVEIHVNGVSVRRINNSSSIELNGLKYGDIIETVPKSFPSGSVVRSIIVHYNELN